jgi:hypothetical protein
LPRNVPVQLTHRPSVNQIDQHIYPVR